LVYIEDCLKKISALTLMPGTMAVGVAHSAAETATFTVIATVNVYHEHDGQFDLFGNGDRTATRRVYAGGRRPDRQRYDQRQVHQEFALHDRPQRRHGCRRRVRDRAFDDSDRRHPHVQYNRYTTAFGAVWGDGTGTTAVTY
jgi:hypothetical protein